MATLRGEIPKRFQKPLRCVLAVDDELIVSLDGFHWVVRDHFEEVDARVLIADGMSPDETSELRWELVEGGSLTTWGVVVNGSTHVGVSFPSKYSKNRLVEDLGGLERLEILSQGNLMTAMLFSNVVDLSAAGRRSCVSRSKVGRRGKG